MVLLKSRQKQNEGKETINDILLQCRSNVNGYEGLSCAKHIRYIPIFIRLKCSTIAILLIAGVVVWLSFLFTLVKLYCRDCARNHYICTMDGMACLFIYKHQGI